MISPLLANIALHGMEEESRKVVKKSAEQPVLIRYADDFVILHSEKETMEKAAQAVTLWLERMSLKLSPSKTRVTHTLTPFNGKVGFDFLGFAIRQFHVGKTHTGKKANGEPLGFKTIIKPSKDAIKNHIRQLNQEVRRMGSHSQEALIQTLTPIIRGWANYYKAVVAKETFSHCDNCVFYQLKRWGEKRHPRKSKKWIEKKYWQRVENRKRFATLVKTTKEHYLLTLRLHSTTKIQRHVKVRGEVSPYDGNLIYWAKRLKEHPTLRTEQAKLLKEQQGMCFWCKLFFKEEDILETDHVIPRAIGGSNDINNKRIYHRHCHDEKTANDMPVIRAYQKAAGIKK